MNSGTLFCSFCIGLAVAALYYAKRRRAASIRSLAARTGFKYLGSAVPKSLTLSGTELECASSLWNVIDGEPAGLRIVAFDCQIGQGKGSWRRTAIAVEDETNVVSPIAISPDLTAETSGKWIILYEPKKFSLFATGLMPVWEVEAYLAAIQDMRG